MLVLSDGQRLKAEFEQKSHRRDGRQSKSNRRSPFNDGAHSNSDLRGSVTRSPLRKVLEKKLLEPVSTAAESDLCPPRTSVSGNSQNPAILNDSHA
jgi:hypothetical protein